MDFDEVTKAAEMVGELGVLSSHGARSIEHILPVPVAMCLRSRNPVGGTISIKYDCDRALEVVTLHRFLRFAATPGEGKPRSTEGWVAYVAHGCADALGAVVWVEARAQVNPGPQVLVIKFTAIPGRRP